MKTKKTRSRNREPFKRISVSIPELMFEDFKAKAKESGISMSKAIYFRLRTRAPIVIVPQEILRQVRQLSDIFRKILEQGALSCEDRELLQSIVKFKLQLVDLESHVEIVHGRKRG